ncbi:hypothetical protein ACFU98_09545 [Streptomyces sp. NPDC057575]|uniref:hypothetical protein n=1 Tax=unclassified Streptomyces TaxID=2593676 RepID=UPI0036A0982B
MALIDGHGDDGRGTRTGDATGHCPELGLVGDRGVDPAVHVLPEDLHRALVGQRGHGRVDLDEQVRPDCQLGTRSELGTQGLDVVV